MNQQLVARIKKTSKYSHQSPLGSWFSVMFSDYRTGHEIFGNYNYYRISDVVLGIDIGDEIVELPTGKRVRKPAQARAA